ncbi:MAG: bifunctional phosphoribosyl-AMP cyclohydrolase/phosphoribosyl-ATP diphosphatase HisIE [Saprospiraceae bacterium]
MKINNLKYDDNTGLIPAIIQDIATGKVLMQGYMNEAAIHKTIECQKVTFYSRSKQRLWTKGETSKNYLHLVSIDSDCDNDSLLVKVNPNGPTCHTGSDTCWNEANKTDGVGFLSILGEVIHERNTNPFEDSYTSQLFAKGINKVAQKVGEEAVELVIEAKDDNEELFLNEAADLMYHYLVLLEAKGYRLNDVCAVLEKRQK